MRGAGGGSLGRRSLGFSRRGGPGWLEMRCGSGSHGVGNPPKPTPLRQAAWGEAARALEGAYQLAEASRRAGSRRGRSETQDSTWSAGGEEWWQHWARRPGARLRGAWKQQARSQRPRGVRGAGGGGLRRRIWRGGGLERIGGSGSHGTHPHPAHCARRPASGARLRGPWRQQTR